MHLAVTVGQHGGKLFEKSLLLIVADELVEQLAHVACSFPAHLRSWRSFDHCMNLVFSRIGDSIGSEKKVVLSTLACIAWLGPLAVWVRRGSFMPPSSCAWRYRSPVASSCVMYAVA